MLSNLAADRTPVDTVETPLSPVSQSQFSNDLHTQKSTPPPPLPYRVILQCGQFDCDNNDYNNGVAKENEIENTVMMI